MNRIISAILLFSLCFSNITFGQLNKIDSLRTAIENAKEDTALVNTLNTLSWELKYGNPDTAIIISTRALVLAEKLKWEKGIGNASKNLGVFNYFIGDYSTALQHYFKALKIKEKANDQKGISAVLGNIGVVYRNQGDYEMALQYCLKSLKIDEALSHSPDPKTAIEKKADVAADLSNIGNIYADQSNYPKALEYYFKAQKAGEALAASTDESIAESGKRIVANTLGNIGIIYCAQGDFSKALSNYFKALKTDEALEDLSAVSSDLGNIGNVYLDMQNNAKALHYYSKALQAAEEAGDDGEMAIWLGNIGDVYYSQGDSASTNGNTKMALEKSYPKALEFYFKALQLSEEQGNKNGMAAKMGNIGAVYTKMADNLPANLRPAKYKEAERYLLKAVAIADSIGALNTAMPFENVLSELYLRTGQHKLSLEHYKKYITARDSIFNEENTKKSMRTEMNFEFEKKEIIAKEAALTAAAIASAESKKQKIIIWSVAAGLLLVLVFSLFLFNRFKITQKQKMIIEEQKDLVEEKHREIKDSINYAERIQRSFLATEHLLNEHLSNDSGRDHFVFFQPKDVVSGDFYWACKLRNGNFALATADSTGHGVPGAIMSILNISCLEKSVEEKQLLEPYEILNHTRIKIIERLKKDGSPEGGKDGMDCSFISFDFPNNKLTYAAANNPIWIVREKAILEFASDKMPVGKHDRDTVSFTQHEIALQKNDVVYSITDGMPDQFGGPKGKKFMYKQLKELLIAIAHLPMSEQKGILASSLNDWKGNLEQIDDVCVIGVRL